MFNLEDEIRNWKLGLRKDGSLEDGYIAELESHLRDEIEDGIRKGKTPETSFTEAVNGLGETDALGAEYYKTDTKRINKRRPLGKNSFAASLLPNYFKVAARNILRHKGYSFINIAGLALGLACCILIALWIIDEMSYDSFHRNAGSIYGIVQMPSEDNEGRHITSTPAPLAESLKEEFPEVIASSRYQVRWSEATVAYKDKLFFEKSLAYTDPSFLNIFSFHLLKGDKNNALSSPNSIVINSDMAVKYFGDENPIGKTILVNNKTSLTVTGVMENIPNNTIFKFSALIPFETFLKEEKNKDERISWKDNYTDTFVQLNDDISAGDFNNKLKEYLKNKADDAHVPALTLLPLQNSRFSNWYGGQKRITAITIFSSIAFIILTIACINFINLSIVSSAKRSKEIGLRKVIGATRTNIAIQFLGEFSVMTLTAFLLATVLAILFMPLFNELFDKSLKLNMLFRGRALLVTTGIIIFTVFAGGVYPALILSSFKPVKILNNHKNKKNRIFSLRSFFVIFQFTVSTTMIILLCVIYSQYKYLRTNDPGFNKEQILYIPLKSNSNSNYQYLKEQLSSIPGITALTGGTNLPSNINRSTAKNIYWSGKNQYNNTLIYFANIDFNFIKTLGIEVISGDDITKEIQTDPKNMLLINEEMAKMIGNVKTIGAELTVRGEKLKVAGIIKDFHFVGYGKNIPPLVMSLISDKDFLTMPNYHILKISPGDFSKVIEQVKTEWKRVNPMVPFEYHFLDEEFDKMYKSEEKLADVIGSFTFIAIIISALGLFGLASYTVEQRKKEIAVRKVLGSGFYNTAGILIKEYFYLVVAANIIAWPLGYFIASMWLRDYAYKIHINAGIFILAGTAALAIMALSVLYQAIKAAVANPIDSLKYE